MSEEQRLSPAAEVRFIAIMEDLWGTFDVDNSGELDHIELRKLMEHIIAPVNIPEDECLRFVSVMDQDGNGRISKSEFSAFCATGLYMTKTEKEEYKKRSEMHEHLEQFFTAMEGRIDRPAATVEDTKVPDSLPPLSIQKLNFWLDQFDEDQNHLVDRGELEWMVSTLREGIVSTTLPSTDEHFRAVMETLDTNKDGRLTRSEFIQWIEQGVIAATRNSKASRKEAKSETETVVDHFWQGVIAWLEMCELPANYPLEKVSTTSKSTPTEHPSFPRESRKPSPRSSLRAHATEVNRSPEKIFSKLYTEGKKRLARRELRVKLAEKRSPRECTFQPKGSKQKTGTESKAFVVQSTVSSIVNAVAEAMSIDHEDIPRRDLLLLLYEAHLADAVKRKFNASVKKQSEERRQTAPVHEVLYNEAARIDERKKANEIKLKTARPKDCSFRPNVSVRKKRPTEGKATPEYYDRIKKSNVDVAKTDRFTLLYVEGEEDRKVERLKIKRQFNDQHVASPAAKVFQTKEAANKPLGGMVNRQYDKAQHLDQIDRMKFERQRNECTFRPKVKASKPSQDAQAEKNVLTRLTKDVTDRKMRTLQRQKNRPAKCTFRPLINKTKAEKNKDNRQKAPAFQRLYDTGQESLKQKQMRHTNREPSVFRPDLSKTRRQNERILLAKKKKSASAKEEGSIRPSPPRKPLPQNGTGSPNLESRRRFRTTTFWEKNIDAKLKKVFRMIDTDNAGFVREKLLRKAFTFDEGIRAELLGHHKLKYLVYPATFGRIEWATSKAHEHRFIRLKYFLEFGHTIAAEHARSPPRRSSPSPQAISKDSTDEELSLAAMKIQATMRGRQARKELRENEEQRQAAMKIQARMRGRATRKSIIEQQEQTKAAQIIQARVRGRKSRKTVSEHKEHAVAASKIQARVRGRKARQFVANMARERAEEDAEDATDGDEENEGEESEEEDEAEESEEDDEAEETEEDEAEESAEDEAEEAEEDKAEEAEEDEAEVKNPKSVPAEKGYYETLDTENGKSE